MKDLFDEFRRIQQDMDRLFHSVFSGPRLLPTKDGVIKQPDTDLKETDNDVIVKFDLPGVKKGDIQLHVDEHSISVKAEREHEKKEENKGYLHHERSYSSFQRSFALPAEVDPNAVNAEYKDGVLTVSMPKKHVERKKWKQIDIK